MVGRCLQMALTPQDLDVLMAQLSNNSLTSTPDIAKPKRKRPSKAPDPLPIPVLITPAIQFHPTLTDPRDYILDMYDNFIAPGITAGSLMHEKIRRAVYRRAIAEFASEEIRTMSALHVISVEDIMNILMSAISKVGLMFA